MTRSLQMLHREVVACELCARLRGYCQNVARDKRRAFKEWTYWGKPVPGFGDSNASLWIIGLAPAPRKGVPRPPRRPLFGHGAIHPLTEQLTLIGSYHVSQQNTFTGKLTPQMFDDVLSVCRAPSLAERQKNLVNTSARQRPSS